MRGRGGRGQPRAFRRGRGGHRGSLAVSLGGDNGVGPALNLRRRLVEGAWRRQAVVGVEHVLAVRDQCLELGEASLADLWLESTQDEQMVLAALSRCLPLAVSRDATWLAAAMAAESVSLAPPLVAATLQRLAARDIVYVEEASAEGGRRLFRWRLGLFGVWIRKRRSI